MLRAMKPLAMVAVVGLCLAHGMKPIEAAEVPVDLELVLAVDISLSMDLDELALQRAGYVEAFRHPAVIGAIGRGLFQRIAVTYVEWAGATLQSQVLPWTMIESPADAEAVAAALAAAPIDRQRRTSISGIIDRSVRLFDSNGFEGVRRVIDVSGDGPNNQGPMVTMSRDAAAADGIVINGLPLILKQAGGFFNVQELDLYYEDCVIAGPGAFLITVRQPSELVEAIRRKLVLEIAGREPELIRAQLAPTDRAKTDCLIGEKLWRRYMQDFE